MAVFWGCLPFLGPDWVAARSPWPWSVVVIVSWSFDRKRDGLKIRPTLEERPRASRLIQPDINYVRGRARA
jgi:hypothetical protein